MNLFKNKITEVLQNTARGSHGALGGIQLCIIDELFTETALKLLNETSRRGHVGFNKQQGIPLDEISLLRLSDI
jgi:hypothetical protein